MMQPRSSIWILLYFFLSLVATPAMAVEFVTVGPRAAGMGGAGVAVTTDAYATYWNPAGLAMVKSTPPVARLMPAPLTPMSVNAPLPVMLIGPVAPCTSTIRPLMPLE